MSKYFLTEPSPSSTSFIRCGRGGAGNTFRASSKTASTITTTTITATPTTKTSSSRRVFGGIGGAGNVHPVTEMPSPTESLDDALRHAAARDGASVGYCGRGGAGNVYRRKDKDRDAASLSSSSSSCSVASLESKSSSSAKLWNRLSSSLSRG
ncbi:hypothetical protein E4U19_005346 [Claviceps sp. Clav32 group G5]|nr:hypothetical protein E4U40_005070 [Claviceps sp. LM458 group G5]KAG6034899.1 hypothetical protein E4U19_005346 [Claviceps sp. Clav32 group G5]KAG6047224.1 hypothetical protein E4U39_000676 [Claviceps sp. Clav50 group G5]